MKLSGCLDAATHRQLERRKADDVRHFAVGETHESCAGIATYAAAIRAHPKCDDAGQVLVRVFLRLQGELAA
jgi:hypothetical protein